LNDYQQLFRSIFVFNPTIMVACINDEILVMSKLNG